MHCIYADNIKQDQISQNPYTNTNSVLGSSPDIYPIGGEIASDEQFEAIEALFNAFYKWYVPKKVYTMKIAIDKMDESMSPEKRYGREGGDTQFDIHVNRILNIGTDQFLTSRRALWVE